MFHLIVVLCCVITGCYAHSSKQKKESKSDAAVIIPFDDSRAKQANEMQRETGKFSRFLKNTVNNEGGISFEKVETHRSDLDSFISFSSSHGPEKKPEWFATEAAKKAFFINVYNANAIYIALNLELHKNKVSYLFKWRRLKFYNQEEVRVDGKTINLTKLENEFIRPLGDARIHFLVNCLAKSCPALVNEALTESNYETVANRQARRFFENPNHCKVDVSRKRVEFSKIMDWYQKDFAPTEIGLIAYANKFRNEAIAENFKVKFLDYDWDLNNVDE